LQREEYASLTFFRYGLMITDTLSLDNGGISGTDYLLFTFTLQLRGPFFTAV